MNANRKQSKTDEASDYFKIPQMDSDTSNTSASGEEKKTQSESRANPKGSEAADKKDVMKKREELIRLSEDGEIRQSVQNLKKASDKIILKIYSEYEIKQSEKANAFLTDLLISKFADLLGGLEAIESSEELEKELVKDKLLKRDVKNVVEKLSPYIPYLGILSGGITVGKHVVKKQFEQKTNEPSTSNEASSDRAEGS